MQPYPTNANFYLKILLLVCNYINRFYEKSTEDNGRGPVWPILVLIICFAENHGKKQGHYKGRTKRVKDYSFFRSFYWRESHCQVNVVSTKSHCLLLCVVLQVAVVAWRKKALLITLKNIVCLRCKSLIGSFADPDHVRSVSLAGSEFG